MDILLHTSEGISPMHEIVESETVVVTPEDKLVFWEALRDRASTIGARNAVDEAIRQMEVES